VFEETAMAADMPDPARLKALVLRILDDNRTLTLATVRADGWPQATVVGFVHDDLTLYFVVSRQSQKLANLRSDPRASLAVGHPHETSREVRGLSMAARIEEVDALDEIERLNKLVAARYPGVLVFAPRTASSAVLRARPQLISLVDDSEGLSQPVLLDVTVRTELKPAASPD
jgi:nitroimidazol reductase NimA-like FMN-containing flavoprotein (pyridoxamine 5'-phosphate oxidase superfamily)